MINPVVGHIALGVYALLLAVGGVMGFVRARSKASLISGLLSAAFAVVALVFALTRSAFGFPLGLTLALCLFVLFGYRYSIRNRKFMPSGLLALVSLVMIGTMVVVMDWSP
ncbi:MAG: TMEM14 family protein [Isosphaeraceae bacterium]|nr:TMEM14 family protein [Isosphaeraceae bacterium]